MHKLFQIGGFVSAAVLIAFGIGAIVMGVNGRSTVQDSLKQELIVGSPDMTPALIKAEAKEAGLDVATLSLPTVNVAGKAINNGTKARAFASYMRIHALEASGGLTYSQMGRFVANPGTPAKLTDGHGATSDEKYALVDPNTKRSVENGARNLWVTETALSTALNTSYMAESLSLFGIVVGIALLLSGIGFGILAVGGTLKRVEPAPQFSKKAAPKDIGAPVAPTASQPFLGRGGARLARAPHWLGPGEHNGGVICAQLSFR
jgi:F0F1-type ATP synthase membrane subunit c/vacuolar-type H+-ATPase subunit K